MVCEGDKSDRLEVSREATDLFPTTNPPFFGGGGSSNDAALFFMIMLCYSSASCFFFFSFDRIHCDLGTPSAFTQRTAIRKEGDQWFSAVLIAINLLPFFFHCDTIHF